MPKVKKNLTPEEETLAIAAKAAKDARELAAKRKHAQGVLDNFVKLTLCEFSQGALRDQLSVEAVMGSPALLNALTVIAEKVTRAERDFDCEKVRSKQLLEERDSVQAKYDAYRKGVQDASPPPVMGPPRWMRDPWR